MAGDRIDMQRLAAELEVDRSTLFRWVGNRDQLIATVLISLADPSLRSAVNEAQGIGGARIARAMGIYAQMLIDAPYYREFMQRETERALKLITTKASPVQQNVVMAFERLLEQECDRGQFSHPMALHDLAYLIVRIAESFIYADFITGEEPDAAKVESAILALLTAGAAA